jgi:hypothetical protein
MPDKIFGADFADESTPIGSDTISVNKGSELKDVALSNIHKALTAGTTTQAGVNALATDAEAIAGSSTSKVLTPASLKAVSMTGWFAANESWTYSSATVVNVASDATTRFQIGWGVRFKQGGDYKYMYVVGVTATTLTLTGGSDYSVANAAITDVAVTPNPCGALGFPGWFNYTPTLSVVTLGNGVLEGKFRISGLSVKWYASFTMGSTSAMGSGVPAFSHPVTLASPFDVYRGHATILDNGSTRYPALANADINQTSCLLPDTGGTYLTASTFSSTAPMTWATGDKLTIELEGMLA